MWRFPCQDVSLARARPRAGLRGQRSGLFFPFAKLVSEALPQVIVIENVPGLLTSHGGEDFGIVLNKLTNLGYGVAWRILNSCHFGVPQSRPRLFLVASINGLMPALRILFDSPKLSEEARIGQNGRLNGSRAKGLQEVLGDMRNGPLYRR